MRKNIKTYEPTPEEAEFMDRSGLVAAWNTLQPMQNEDLSISEKVLICLRAFKAANTSARLARKHLKDLHPEADRIYYSPEITDIVCSALIGLDLADPNDIHPNSIIGGRVSTLFQAAKVLEAMSQVYSALDDNDAIFGTYLDEEAVSFVEEIMRTNKE